MRPARELAHDSIREVNLRLIQDGLESYYDQYGRYPSSLDELSSQYLSTIPADPKTHLPYQYQRRGDKDYQICAQLETKPQKCITPQSK